MKLTPRLTDSRVRLLARAAGSPSRWPGKAYRFVHIAAGYLRGRRLDERLARLAARGWMDRVPTRVQLFVGSVDMVRFWISPASSDYYRQRGIGYTFHQVLRLLDEPASLADPVGFFSERDGIIAHLMQVVHANPVYDLQLLDLFDDGLAQLELQLEQMIAGTHPRAQAIGAIVEEADYHERLLAYVRAFRENPTTPPPLRVNISASPHFATLERTFGSLPGAMRYFTTLPDTWPAALRHLREVKSFAG